MLFFAVLLSERMMPSESRQPPIPRDVAQQASKWLVLFMSGTASQSDRGAWEHWRQSHPEHDRAWRHIESVNQRFKDLPGSVALPVLTSLPPSNRRKLVKALCWGSILVGTGLFVQQTPVAIALRADYHTAVGKRRTLMLADGSQVIMNANSSLDVAFNGQRRLLQLRKGEILVTTGHTRTGTLPPFIVASEHGSIRALGTRFIVRQEDNATFVGVLEGAVEVTAGQQKIVVPAGSATYFSFTTINPPEPVTDNITAWSQGVFVADNMQLKDLLNILGGYRKGYIFCDTEIASLRVSGVYSLDDTDSTLAALTDALPVDIRYRTRYWVTVVARK